MLKKTCDHLNNIMMWELDDRVKIKSGCFGKFADITLKLCTPIPLLLSILETWKPFNGRSKKDNLRKSTFTFNEQKLYFGLEDVFYLTGLPIDGRPVTGIELYGPESSKRYLGKDYCHKKTKGMISLDVLRSTFQYVRKDIDERSEEFKYHVRACILYVLGSFLLPGKTGGKVSAHYLSMLEDLDDLESYAWGAAFLAHFYHAMKNMTKNGVFGGQSFFLILFVLERVPSILRIVIDAGTIDENFYPMTIPLVVGWAEKLSRHLSICPKKLKTRDKQLYANAIMNLGREDILWKPYKRLSILTPITATCRTSIICFEKVADHQPDLVPLQYDVLYDPLAIIPSIRKRSYGRNARKGVCGIDWSTKDTHIRYITCWNNRSASIIKDLSEHLTFVSAIGDDTSTGIGEEARGEDREQANMRDGKVGEEDNSFERGDASGTLPCHLTNVDEFLMLVDDCLEPVTKKRKLSELNKCESHTSSTKAIKPKFSRKQVLEGEGTLKKKIKMEQNNCISLVSADPFLALLAVCHQSAPKTLRDVFSMYCDTKSITKVGEGAFGEAFRAGNIVCKILPFDRDMLVNGEVQKKSEELLNCLSNRSDDAYNACTIFIKTLNLIVCQGSYDPTLIDAWEYWEKENGSENDDPKDFSEKQCYLVFVLQHGGKDLKNFVLLNFDEARSLLVQVTAGLAVAEAEYEFEHRDLHWGNILLIRNNSVALKFTLEGKRMAVKTYGICISIIDYTLSRMTTGERRFFLDLEENHYLFKRPKGDKQSETYRKMKKVVGGDWAGSFPRTNVLWLVYLVDMLLTQKTFVRSSEDQRELTLLKKRLNKCNSAKEAILDPFFTNLFV